MIAALLSLPPQRLSVAKLRLQSGRRNVAKILNTTARVKLINGNAARAIHSFSRLATRRLPPRPFRTGLAANIAGGGGILPVGRQTPRLLPVATDVIKPRCQMSLARGGGLKTSVGRLNAKTLGGANQGVQKPFLIGHAAPPRLPPGSHFPNPHVVKQCHRQCEKKEPNRLQSRPSGALPGPGAAPLRPDRVNPGTPNRWGSHSGQVLLHTPNEAARF